MPAGTAGEVLAPCATGSRKARRTSGWVRNGMGSSCPVYENVSSDET